MPQTIQSLIDQYISEIKKIYGSYARGDFRVDSDVDIMILLDMSDLDLKVYSQELVYMTYDFNHRRVQFPDACIVTNLP